MKNVIKRIALISALLMVALVNGYAQESTQVKKTVEEIVKKYDGTKGVECISLVKGGGLDMVKMMFRKQFGKDFMKGVTSITLIEYSGASDDVRAALRGELNVFSTLLKEFDISKEQQFADSSYVKCFASELASGALTDFIVALESDKSKVMLYMSGEIKVE